MLKWNRKKEDKKEERQRERQSAKDTLMIQRFLGMLFGKLMKNNELLFIFNCLLNIIFAKVSSRILSSFLKLIHVLKVLHIFQCKSLIKCVI